MHTPPPVPAPFRAVRAIRFDGSKWGLRGSVERERSMIEMAEREAEDWLAANAHVDVVSITSAMGEGAAFVTVWYRE